MNQKRTYAIHTLGCKLNFSESSTLSRQLKDKGIEQKKISEQADIYIINTCSVTDNADKECQQIVRKLNTLNPEAFIVITGCYAQLKPNEIASLKGVDLVLGASEKFNLVEHIINLTHKGESVIHNCEIEDIEDFKSAFSYQDRTRAFLKIQDGCDYGCSYCTIPLARGKSRSDNLKNIVHNIQLLEKQNIKEVVLTGVNLGDYNFEGYSFIDVLKQIEQLPSPIERYRISSIEPNLLSNEIIEFVAQSRKIMPHFHIPLQSGSNKILGLMRRRYQKDLYAEKVALIKKMIPHAGIGVDVIVGFPQESDVLFNETFDFLHQLDVSYLHVFTYSERQNTIADLLEPKVPISQRKKRNAILRNLSLKKANFFKSQFSGQKRKVLFESRHNNIIEGYTDNYIKIEAPYSTGIENHIVEWEV